MLRLSLSFPLFVKPDKGVYHVMPLLFKTVAAEDARYETALRKFARSVREYLRDDYTDQDVENIGWFLFNPRLTFQRLSLSVQTGTRLTTGTIAVVFFELQKNRYVVLPGLQHGYFVATANEQGRYDMPGEVTAYVQRYARENAAMPEFDPDLLLGDHKSFVSTFKLQVEVPRNVFPFAQAADRIFFDLPADFTPFNGGAELRRASVELNDLYPDELMRCLHRGHEVERLSEQIYGESRTAIALVGPTGSGRTAIVHECVRRYISALPPQHGAHKTTNIWLLDPVRVISGMSIVGQWQRRMQAILDYLLEKAASHKRPPDKLYVDNLIGLLHIGKSSHNKLSLADLLKPYLEERRLTLIVEATPEQWTKAQEIHRGFTDLFQVQRVAELPMEQWLDVVAFHRAQLEQKHGCEFHTDALPPLIEWYGLKPQVLAKPGGIIAALNRLAVRHKNGAILEQMAVEDIQSISHMRRALLHGQSRLDASQVRQHFSKQLIGQKDAVQALTDTVVLQFTGLHAPGRPIRSLLFIGPTGVGKTQAAKVLAQYLYTGADALIRYDMNEYVDASAAARLIGTPSQPEGLLTGKVRHRPHAVLLFDEIEKADSSVHDLLLQVLGDGRLSDHIGRTTDFCNCIIIMTSNLGAVQAESRAGFVTAGDDAANTYKQAVENHFRPEFVNRIDQLVVFRPLQPQDIKEVAALQMRQLLQREGFIRRMTVLNVEKDALDFIAQRGFDPHMGGRALKRRLEADIVGPSAGQLVNTLPENPVIFHVRLRNGVLQSDIHALNYAVSTPVALPEYPHSKQRLVFFRNLLRRVDQLLMAIDRRREDSEIPGNNAWMDLVEQCKDVKDVLSEYTWQLEALHDSPRLAHGAQNLHVPLTSLFTAHELRVLPQPFSGAQMKEAYDYLVRRYPQADILVDSTRSEFHYFHRRVVFLEYFFRQNGRVTPQRMTISMVAAVKVPEFQPILQQLQALYVGIIRGVGFEVEHAVLDAIVLEAEIAVNGRGVCDVFRAECGVHLFYLPFGQVLPLQISVTGMDIPNARDEVHEIVRLFTLNEQGDISHALDVRSTWLMRWPACSLYWPWLMLSASLPHGDKLE